MDTWVAIAQNIIFVLALGFLYDVAHRLYHHRPALPWEVLLGVVFSLMVFFIHLTPVLHFTRDIHIAFVLLVYASLMGGWVTGGMAMATYIAVDIFILPSPITVPYLTFLSILVGLGYALRVGYKASVSAYTLAELSAVCLVMICLNILIPLVFNTPNLLFSQPELFAQLTITASAVFMLLGVVLRRTMALHESELEQIKNAEYEQFLAKAISDEIYRVDFDEFGSMKRVDPIFFEGANLYQNPTKPDGSIDWVKFIHPDDEGAVKQLLTQLLRGEPATAELRLLQSATKTYEWRRIYGAPIMHPSKDYVQTAYFSSKDISAEKLAKMEHDKAKLERERVAILKAFSLQSEHQFRTPLTSIHSNLYLLRKVTDETKRARYLDVIEKQAHLLLELVESLSLLTQIEIREELTEYSLNLNEIVQGLLPTYIKEASAKDVKIESVLAQDLPKLRGSHLYIKSSVQHLIRNAVAYTPSGGNITVSTRIGKTKTGYKAVELVVEDTGVGMSDTVLEHVFERFYRADVAQTTSGLGLGLPLVKEVALHYGGQVNIFSTEGKGTVVVLALPVLG